MRWVDAAKGVEKLPGFDLQAERQTRRLQKRLFELDLCRVTIVELEDNVSEAFEIRIDRTVDGDFRVARIEATLLRIVVADFDLIQVARAGTGEREHAIERNVHVILASATGDWDRLRQGRAGVRRVDINKCNGCHSYLSLHGENRNQIEMCALCHNPSENDSSQRPNAVVASDKALPPQSVNFALMVHKIHTGVT